MNQEEKAVFYFLNTVIFAQVYVGKYDKYIENYDCSFFSPNVR
jgi:hypothetical protein